MWDEPFPLRHTLHLYLKGASCGFRVLARFGKWAPKLSTHANIKTLYVQQVGVEMKFVSFMSMGVNNKFIHSVVASPESVRILTTTQYKTYSLY